MPALGFFSHMSYKSLEILPAALYQNAVQLPVIRHGQSPLIKIGSFSAFSLPAAWRTGFCPGQFPVVCLLRPVPRLCHFQISWHPSAYPSIGNPACSIKPAPDAVGCPGLFVPHGRGFHTPRLPGYSESGPAQPARPFWSCVYLLFPAGNPWESFCNRIHRQRQRVLSENQLPGWSQPAPLLLTGQLPCQGNQRSSWL